MHIREWAKIEILRYFNAVQLKRYTIMTRALPPVVNPPYTILQQETCGPRISAEIDVFSCDHDVLLMLPNMDYKLYLTLTFGDRIIFEINIGCTSNTVSYWWSLNDKFGMYIMFFLCCTKQ